MGASPIATTPLHHPLLMVSLCSHSRATLARASREGPCAPCTTSSAWWHSTAPLCSFFSSQIYAQNKTKSLVLQSRPAAETRHSRAWGAGQGGYGVGQGGAQWCTAASCVTGLSPLPISNCHLATKAFATPFSFGPLASSLPTVQWQAQGGARDPSPHSSQCGNLLKACYKLICSCTEDSWRRQGQGLWCDVFQEQFS